MMTGKSSIQDKQDLTIFWSPASPSQTFISAPDEMIWLHHC
jgi:hypothetical protein